MWCSGGLLAGEGVRVVKVETVDCIAVCGSFKNFLVWWCGWCGVVWYAVMWYGVL